ncbi:trypsin domain-containing protein [Phthorimaea operculella]|nr:trypsin domain-containing protein [Phthorimaea operculella]
MKGFALIVLCFVAAAQARSALPESRAAAELGENPWFVHLRIAVTTSGFLNTCAGSLIGNSWILTAKACVDNPSSRFIWSRYGVVDVYRPSLVTEGNVVRLHPSQDVALININRNVEFSDNIQSIPLASAADEVDSARFCGFGALDDGNAPGENLNCGDVSLSLADNVYTASSDDIQATRGTYLHLFVCYLIAPGENLNCGDVSLSLADDVYSASSDDIQATRFDLGAPLVKDGQQIGVLTAASWQNAGSFVSVASVRDWIDEQISA